MIPQHSLINRGWFQALILLAGIGSAFILSRSSLVDIVWQYGVYGELLVIFFAGFMYSSVLTVAPATIAIVKIAEAGVSLPLLALVGGAGAMLADLTLFRLMKVSFIDHLLQSLERAPHGRLAILFQIKLFRFMLVVVGALTIATPIPDEIGLALMGMGAAHWSSVAVIGFIFNSIGIGLIGYLSV